jgi:siroheme synthase
MGVSKLSEISKRLMRAGLAPLTPIAAIEWGTTKRQKTLLLTLAEASSGFHVGKVEPPAVIVVGKIASLATKLGWYSSGKVIMSPAYRLTYQHAAHPRRSKKG